MKKWTTIAATTQLDDTRNTTPFPTPSPTYMMTPIPTPMPTEEPYTPKALTMETTLCMALTQMDCFQHHQWDPSIYWGHPLVDRVRAALWITYVPAWHPSFDNLTGRQVIAYFTIWSGLTAKSGHARLMILLVTALYYLPSCDMPSIVQLAEEEAQLWKLTPERQVGRYWNSGTTAPHDDPDL